MAEPDQSPEERLPSDERLGAINRIENPAEVGLFAYAAELFTVDAVGGELGLDELAHRRLRIPVCDRHRALRVRTLRLVLALHLQRLPPVREDLLARGVGERAGESGELVELLHLQPVWSLQRRRCEERAYKKEQRRGGVGKGSFLSDELRRRCIQSEV